ncbi:MAG: crossover junction endodeoxyribonuclease RuvC [Candidatus Chisholmbacteria bacterium RIFCSPHIGHO2_01_FULL_48_12]|uniref:Crossover junction endodeoxyribonuclease RuvC n=1 Tax=Candidatus Chisholmbacteria bacterium RIFCSPHIGHO2_01_FULL_48_12 TaxID=1797589 RepID=A0A1G1VND3_9BACT|nr:MAG: crossover junction endodeoxyribonuclease RuvC [Candidatus Chisholmbacteria bacterium RIFCSPHIGHO2_01_FULL_48_12]
MLILGIDPGTAETGLGIISTTPKAKLVFHACITTPKTDFPETRLNQIWQQLTGIIKTHQPEVLAMESLFFATNAKTVMAVGQAMGVVMLAAAQAGMPVFKYSPLQVKRLIAGDGKAEKSALQEKVRQLLRLKTVPRPQHAADALAVALCHSLQGHPLRS